MVLFGISLIRLGTNIAGCFRLPPLPPQQINTNEEFKFCHFSSEPSATEPSDRRTSKALDGAQLLIAQTLKLPGSCICKLRGLAGVSPGSSYHTNLQWVDWCELTELPYSCLLFVSDGSSPSSGSRRRPPHIMWAPTTFVYYHWFTFHFYADNRTVLVLHVAFFSPLLAKHSFIYETQLRFRSW